MIERNVADSVRAVLVDPYPTGRIALGRGPRQAMRHVDLNLRTPQQKRIWLEEARLNAILGGCKVNLIYIVLDWKIPSRSPTGN